MLEGVVGARGRSCVLLWRCPVYRWRELVAGAGMEQENLSSRYTTVRHGQKLLPGGERENSER